MQKTLIGLYIEKEELRNLFIALWKPQCAATVHRISRRFIALSPFPSQFRSNVWFFMFFETFFMCFQNISWTPAAVLFRKNGMPVGS